MFYNKNINKLLDFLESSINTLRTIVNKDNVKEKKYPARKQERVHNCWDCKRTTDYSTKKGCFNKAYPPKESSEGLDCDQWV